MATTYADTVTTTNLPDALRAIYSNELEFTAQPKLIYDQFAEPKGDFQAKRGERVYWTIFRNLPPAINALTENQDIDGGQMADFQVSFTVDEYGYSIGTTEKMELLSYFGPISNIVRQVLGPQMAITLDVLARNAFFGSGAKYRFYGGTATSRATLAAGDNITESIIRQMGYHLSVRRVPLQGNGYANLLHPSVTYDVRSLAGWTNANLYAGAVNIFNGEVGMLHGMRFVEADNARIPNAGANIRNTTLSAAAAAGDDHIHVASSAGFAAGDEITIYPAVNSAIDGTDADEEHVVVDSVDTGLINLREKLLIAHASSDKVKDGLDIYPVIALGALPALGKGIVVSPEVRVALPTDKLRRINHVGWYTLLGYGVLRNWAYDLWEISASQASAPAHGW